MQKEEKKRIEWIDTLRGFAMFLVIWGHCQKNGTFIRKWIYSFHMPLFFLISGLTFGESDKLPFKTFFKKKVKGLLLPYLALNVVCYILDILYYKVGIISNFSFIKSFLGVFYSSNRVLPIPCGPSWFLVSLFIVEMIFYFFKKNTKTDFELGMACTICGIISYVNSICEWQIRSPWHIEAVLMGVLFYFIGYLFMKYINKFDFILKDKFRLFFYGAALGAGATAVQYFNRRVSMDGNLYGSITLFLICSLSFIAALIMFVNFFMKKSKFFNNIGKNTVFYLGYHYMIALVLMRYFPKYFNSSLYVVLIAMGITIVMYPLSLLVKKYIPVLIGKINIKALN